MKKYCIDTSGFSNPLEHMPEDIHVTLWSRVTDVIATGAFAATTEIFEELERLRGDVGESIAENESVIKLEIGSNE